TKYFLANDVSKWCLRTAFQSQEEKTPNLSIRHLLQEVKSDVKAAAKSEEPERAKAAEDLLHNWRVRCQVHQVCYGNQYIEWWE
ncbi:hypothetical protein BX666DRAFT_1899537, partial [Dichotomocladium elegans]